MSENQKLVKLNITFRNTEATDAIKTYANEKIGSCLKKFVHQDTEAHVILKVEKNRQIAEVTFRTSGNDFVATEESADLYSSIDAVSNTVAHQLRKHKEKITNHH